MSYLNGLKGLILLTVMAVLSACGGGGGEADSSGAKTAASYAITNGSFQKGPFIAGTTVIIQELDDNLAPTGKSYTTTTNSAGSFSMSKLIGSRFVEVFANGFYFDELTGKKSTAPVTLRGIIDLSKNNNLPSINLLTTLQANRLRTLKNQGMSFEDAQLQAKNAVLDVFSIPANLINNFNEVNLVGDAASDHEFVRASVAMLKVARSEYGPVEANLSAQVGLLAEDLNDDGQINGLAKIYLPLLVRAKQTIDPLLIQTGIKSYLAGYSHGFDDGILTTELLYSFDEGGEVTEPVPYTRAHNMLNHTWNGEITNAVRNNGKVGRALDFSASEHSYITVRLYNTISSGMKSLLFDTKQVSISTWLKLNSLDLGKTYQIMGDSGGWQSIELLLEEGKVKFNFKANNNPAGSTNDPIPVIASKTQLVANKWYHIAVTYNGSTAIMYIDGEVDNTREFIHPFIEIINDTYIGGSGPYNAGYTPESLPGMLDEFRFSTTIQTPEEIKSYFDAGQ